MRNKIDAQDFACPHGGERVSCPQCQEIDSILQDRVPEYRVLDYDRKVRHQLPPSGDDGEERSSDDGLLTRKEWRARRLQELRDESGGGGSRNYVEIVRVRGQRGRQAYLKVPGRDSAEGYLLTPKRTIAARLRQAKFALVRVPTREERMNVEAEIRHLREERTLWEAATALPRVHSLAIPMHDSPMARLFGLLLGALFGIEAAGRPGLRRGEWAHNLAWARRRLRGGGARTQSRGSAAVFRQLVRGLKACPACAMPMLVGCRLHGERITRRRVYCDDACKMRAVRQSRRVRLAAQ